MAFLMEDVAAGAKASVDTRYAEPRAAIDLAQQQATLEGLNAQNEAVKQQNELRKYDLTAAADIASMAAEPEPKVDYAGIYGQVSSQKQKVALAKQKLDRAEALAKKTMASGKYSETTRKMYEDAQKEYKETEAAHKAFQVESLRKVLDPALAARDQTSWDAARPKLAEATAEATVQAAIESGVPQENLERLRQDVYNQTMQQLPKKYDASAQNLIRTKVAEYKGLEEAWKMDEQQRKEEKHAAEIKKLQSEERENQAQTEKALAEARNIGKEGAGNSKLAEGLKKQLDAANTEYRAVETEINSIGSQITEKRLLMKEATTKEEQLRYQEEIAQLGARRTSLESRASQTRSHISLTREMLVETSPALAAAVDAQAAKEEAQKVAVRKLQSKILMLNEDTLKGAYTLSEEAGYSSIKEMLTVWAEANPDMTVTELIADAKAHGAIQ